MEGDNRVLLLALRNVAFEPHALRLQLGQPRLELRRHQALGDGVDDPLYLLGHVREARGRLRALPAAGRLQLLALGVVEAHELRDGGGRHQLLLDACQHALLQRLDLDRAVVRAGAGPRLAMRAASHIVLGLHHIGAAADGAAHQPRQQVLCPRPGCQRKPGMLLLHGLDGVPHLVRDDAQIRHLHHRPFFRRVQARDALTCLRVLDERLPVVDQPPDIQGIPEDAVPPRLVPVDGAGEPRLAGRRRYALTVQVGHDGPRPPAGGVFPEDAAHHLGLGLVDDALPADRLALRVELAHHLVAVGQPAGHLPLQRPTLLAAPHLLRQIAQEEGVHRALEADVQLADGAFRDGDKLDASERQALVNAGDVFLVARQAVQGFRHDGVEQPGAGVLQQPHGVGAGLQVRATDGVIGVDLHHRAAESGGVLPAQPDLIVDAPLVLVLAAVSSVDRDPHA